MNTTAGGGQFMASRLMTTTDNSREYVVPVMPNVAAHR